MNRKTSLAAGVAAIMAAAVLAITTNQAAFAGNTVNIDIVSGAATLGDKAFSPGSPEAHVGDSVIWTNKDTTAHTATSGANNKADGKFGVDSSGGPQLIMPNKSQEFKPTATGEFSYFCALHPSMVGKFKVD